MACIGIFQMAIVLRIDVDRPYGCKGFFRHCISRLSSDLYFPRFECFSYLKELSVILHLLNLRGIRAYVFFRKCTLPSSAVVDIMNRGGHKFGLHLENSKSYKTFVAELRYLQRRIQQSIEVFSKHGSGKHRHGFHHYPPYEPLRYLEWARRAQMKAFLGNNEEPAVESFVYHDLVYVPAAFWLEPSWRDTARYTVDWLLRESTSRSITLLVHPDGILSDESVWKDFLLIVNRAHFTLLPHDCLS